MATYSRETQAIVAASLPTAPVQVRAMIEDYGDLRARVRAACGK